MKPASRISEPSCKVLFLIPTLHGGGAERVAVTLLRHLDRAKFRLALAVVDGRGAAYQEDLPKDLEFVDLQTARIRNALHKICRLIWQDHPDIVFSTLGHLNLALAMMRPLLPKNTRLVARETGIFTEENRSRSHPKLWSFGYRRFYARLDAVICQSTYMRDDLVNNCGLPPESARIISNPVDIHRIRSLARERSATGIESPHVGRRDSVIHVVAAGRLSREKGFDLLLEALALCRNPMLRLTILGQGPLRQDLEQMARSLRVEHQVTFAGFQNNPYPFLAQADIFVLSSRYEGFPNVVLEAMACGTPVVATPGLGGAPEILRGVPGCILAEEVTAASLARAIQSFPVGQRLSAGVVDSYAVEKIASEYSRTLLDVLGAGAARRHSDG